MSRPAHTFPEAIPTEDGRLGSADRAATASQRSPQAVSGIAGIPDAETRTADLAKWHSVFVDSKADFIMLDGWVGQPARERVRRAEGEGWLVFDRATSDRASDEQYTALCYRPTQALRDLLAEQVPA